MKNQIASETLKLKAMQNVSVFFNFQIGERIIWLAPVTASRYAIFNGTEVKLDGNVYAKITCLPGMSNLEAMDLHVPIEEIIPAWD